PFDVIRVLIETVIRKFREGVTESAQGSSGSYLGFIFQQSRKTLVFNFGIALKLHDCQVINGGSESNESLVAIRGIGETAFYPDERITPQAVLFFQSFLFEGCYFFAFKIAKFFSELEVSGIELVAIDQVIGHVFTGNGTSLFVDKEHGCGLGDNLCTAVVPAYKVNCAGELIHLVQCLYKHKLLFPLISI